MSKNIGVAYTMKKKAKSKQEKGVNPKSYEKGVSEAGRSVREASEGGKEHHMKKMEKAKMEHESVLEEMREMPAPQLKAEGGTVEETPSEAGAGPASKIECPNCKHNFAHGGQVADAMPNEFDYVENEDLVARAMKKR